MSRRAYSFVDSFVSVAVESTEKSFQFLPGGRAPEIQLAAMSIEFEIEHKIKKEERLHNTVLRRYNRY